MRGTEWAATFYMTFQDDDPFRITFEDVIEVHHGGGDPYQGPYEATPIFEEIILPTKNKHMNSDVTVHKIPVAVVENPGGGNTVTIGG